MRPLIALLFAFGSVLTATLSIAAVDEPPAKAVRWFDKATRAFQKNDNASAIAGFDRAIAAYPGYEAAIYNRALALAEVGRDRDAVTDLATLQQRSAASARKLAGLFQIHAMATISIASAALEREDLDDAEKYLERALTYDPNSADAYIYRGVLRRNQGRNEDAIADYAQAIARNPDSSIAHFNRGLILLERDQHREAIADFTRAIELEPEDPSAYQGRAQAYEALGDKESAHKDQEMQRKLCGDCAG
jgi:tetratricopeptide (TPR) repeat protein